MSVEQRIRRRRSFELAYGYRVTKELLDAIDPDDLFLLETLTGRFTSAALIDRRDDPFDATTGWYSSLTIERVSEFESGADSIKVLGTLYYFWKVGQITLASAARVGGAFLDPLPFSDRFFVGGADTVRGYPENGAGPRNLLGQAAGGNAQLILNQELRTPLYGWVKGVRVRRCRQRLPVEPLHLVLRPGPRLRRRLAVRHPVLVVPARPRHSVQGRRPAHLPRHRADLLTPEQRLGRTSELAERLGLSVRSG